MDSEKTDTELDLKLLQALSQPAPANQRELARRIGVSVGKINFCMRAVVERGWVKVNNFRRADNKLAYAYLLTPSGMHAKISLAKAFLVIKEREFEQLQCEIDALRNELSESDRN